MRPLTLAALTSTALTAVVAHAHVTYASGATLDGSVVCTNNFSSVVSMNAILSGYDSSGSGFVGRASPTRSRPCFPTTNNRNPTPSSPS